MRAEIQITSILRHAWSEIEHEWYDLKDAYPDAVKRRFYRIAALLELAESEFLEIKKGRRQYEQSVAVRVGANDLDVQVDAVSIRPFIQQEPLVAEVDNAIANALGRQVSSDLPDKIVERRARAARLAGMATLQDVRDLLLRYREVVPAYSAQCRRELWGHIPPSPTLGQGVSIYHMSMLIAVSKGVDAAVEFYKQYGINPIWNVDRQVVIGRGILEGDAK